MRISAYFACVVGGDLLGFVMDISECIGVAGGGGSGDGVSVIGLASV